MNRSLIVLLLALVLILFSSLVLGAQGRGHFAGGRGFNTTPVVTPGFAAGPRPPFAVAPGHVPSFGVRPVHPVRPGFVPPVFSYYSPYIWPSTIYGSPYSLYPAQVYPQPAYTYPETAAPAVSQNDLDLAYQVGQLSAQVEQLRQQQQQGVNSSQQSQPPVSTPTVLVFRDGRRMEIQNYAIVDDILWVLDQKVATKIQLSDLDLDATQKENRSRGVRFLLPQK